MNEDLQNLATAINISLEALYGEKMGFALLAFRFSDIGGVGDYVSNANRGDMVKALREAANKLENNETIGRPIGTA